jgi:hypothetical protein
MTDHDAGPIEKPRSLHLSRHGVAAGAMATVAARRSWEARAQDSPAGGYQGETVDTIFGQA